MSMKCVRMLENSEIRRIKTEVAQKLVTNGKAVYVCKGIWKLYRRTMNLMKELSPEATNEI